VGATGILPVLLSREHWRDASGTRCDADQLPVGQLRQIRAEPRADQPGIGHAGSGQRDDPLEVGFARQEQPPNGHDVLIIGVPDGPPSPDRSEEVDMRARQSGRMGTGKLGRLDPVELLAGNRRAGGFAQIQVFAAES